MNRFLFIRVLEVFLCALLLSSCVCSGKIGEKDETGSSEWEETWIVASRTHETHDDNGIAWWIKRNGDDVWTLHYPPFVEGFEYEEGYEYKLLVKAVAQDIENLPADTPSVFYYLISIISKEQKESEGIPF